MATAAAATPAKKTARARKTAKQAETLVDCGDSFAVNIPSLRSWSVHFTRGAFNPENPLLKDIIGPAGGKPRVFAVVDYNVARQTPGLPARIAAALDAAGIAAAGKPLLVAGGEQSKNDGGRTAWAIANTALAAGLSRGDFMFAIGGGAVLDAAGFAAGVLNGGVRLVRFPTTLLAQTSAGIGMRCAVGTPDRKDVFSVDAAPWAVVDDSEFLSTLTPENFRNGIPGAIASAATGDRALLEWIDAEAPKIVVRDPAAVNELVRRTVAVNLRSIVETGSVPLFGCWAANRLQEIAHWRIWHGYALAMGICIDSAYAVQSGWIGEEDGDLVGTALHKTGGLYGLQRFGQLLEPPDSVLKGLDNWRERCAGVLSAVYPGPLGSAHVEEDPDRELYSRIIAELSATRRELAAARAAETSGADDAACAASGESAAEDGCAAGGQSDCADAADAPAAQEAESGQDPE